MNWYCKDCKIYSNQVKIVLFAINNPRGTINVLKYGNNVKSDEGISSDIINIVSV